MQLSTKSRYGLRAVLHIARRGGTISAKRKDIADQEGISSSYLENILLVLRNHKIVETVRGVKGGYMLSGPPSRISVYDIVNALEGPLAIVECVEKPGCCERTPTCISRLVWCELAENIHATLKKISLQSLLDREKKSAFSDYAI